MAAYRVVCVCGGEMSCKSIYWGPRLSMQTERYTDSTNLVVAFHNFVNMPKNVKD